MRGPWKESVWKVKRMKRRTKVTLVFAALAALALGLWFLIPRSLDQALGQGFQRDEVYSVQALLMNQEETRSIVLTPSDPVYADLMALLDKQRYLPAFPREVQDLRLSHHVTLAFASNGQDHCIDLTGEAPMRFSGSDVQTRWFRSAQGQAFQQAVLDLLLAQEDD